MGNCKVLAFLLCDKATIDRAGRVTLHELFDGIVIPRGDVARPFPRFGVPRNNSQMFHAFYKINADQQCRISLGILDPSGREVPGNWRDSITPQSPSVWQAIWELPAALFHDPGWYKLDLVQENDYPLQTSFCLASTSLLVAQGG